MRRLLPLSLICTLLMAGVARSTTVIPPTFESLVSSANTIFVGEVMNVRAEWMATRDGRAIKTYVTFRSRMSGRARVGAVTQLEFLGGTIGETTMEVVGMPTFREGQRSVLFVHGEVQTRESAGRLLARAHARREGSERRRSRPHLRRPIARQPDRGRREPPELHAVGHADAAFGPGNRRAVARARREGAMRAAWLRRGLAAFAVATLVIATSQSADGFATARIEVAETARSPMNLQLAGGSGLSDGSASFNAVVAECDGDLERIPQPRAFRGRERRLGPRR